MDDLTSARLGLGDHHATILIYGDTAEGVRQALAQTATALAEEAVGFRPLDRALEAGFWAQLPGNWHWRPRPVPITSLNFLCFSSLHNQLNAKPVGTPRGPPDTRPKTQTGSPYFFTFHAFNPTFDNTTKLLPA